MVIYRIRQLLRALACNFSIIGEEENIYLKKYLDNKQLELFNKLSIYDKKHSLYTAKDIDKELKGKIQKNDLKILIKVALLHDIGKINIKLSLIDRAFLVVMDTISERTLKKIKINLLKEKINIYYNHGEIGFNLLKNYICNYEILYIIRYHHNNKIDNYKLKIFQKFDSEN